VIEILRRFGLLGALCAAAWLWFSSPPLLIGVRKPDFDREYRRKFAFTAFAEPGSKERNGRMTLDEFRRRTLESRILPQPASDITAWLKELNEAFSGRGPEARRVRGGEAFYLPREEPVSQWVKPLEDVYRQGSWLNAWLSTGNNDLEFFLHREPRDSQAPEWILYPRRASAWKWALAGVLLYFLLPRRRGNDVRHDPVPILVLDWVGAALACFFWALPLALYETNESAVADWLGPPGVSWLAAGAIAALLLNNAARAAGGVALQGDSMRLSSLFRSREIPYSSVRLVLPLEDGEIPSGVRLRLAQGREVVLPWSGRMNFTALLDELRARGVPRAQAASIVDPQMNP